jgi:hypothetical protein
MNPESIHPSYIHPQLIPAKTYDVLKSQVMGTRLAAACMRRGVEGGL